MQRIGLVTRGDAVAIATVKANHARTARISNGKDRKLRMPAIMAKRGFRFQYSACRSTQPIADAAEWNSSMLRAGISG